MNHECNFPILPICNLSIFRMNKCKFPSLLFIKEISLIEKLFLTSDKTVHFKFNHILKKD